MERVDCSHFNGYKPCGLQDHCTETCSHFKKRGPQILLVHLGALGAVVRTTGLLSAIHSEFPHCEITWVTENPAAQLLRNHPRLKRVLTLNETDLLILETLVFERAYVIDKSLEATGVLHRARVSGPTLGFKANAQGVILPLNPEAEELWGLGLSNEKKFFLNQKSEWQLLHEALKLKPVSFGYDLPLTIEEEKEKQNRRKSWLQDSKTGIVGLNTGCAPTLPHKKLSVKNHRDLILLLEKNFPELQIVLLGGPEDTERNQLIAENRDVLLTPTTKGLRDGLISVAACDYVVTGDSLGMHMAISQKIPTLAWFGPSCSQEIDFFGYGEKILTKANCSPCWKRSCIEKVMCYDQVDLLDFVEALHRQLRKAQNKLHHSDRLSR